jgi:hypothetical protein
MHFGITPEEFFGFTYWQAHGYLKVMPYVLGVAPANANTAGSAISSVSDTTAEQQLDEFLQRKRGQTL